MLILTNNDSAEVLSMVWFILSLLADFTRYVRHIELRTKHESSCTTALFAVHLLECCVYGTDSTRFTGNANCKYNKYCYLTSLASVETCCSLCRLNLMESCGLL